MYLVTGKGQLQTMFLLQNTFLSHTSVTDVYIGDLLTSVADTIGTTCVTMNGDVLLTAWSIGDMTFSLAVLRTYVLATEHTIEGAQRLYIYAMWILGGHVTLVTLVTPPLRNKFKVSCPDCPWEHACTSNPNSVPLTILEQLVLVHFCLYCSFRLLNSFAFYV